MFTDDGAMRSAMLAFFAGYRAAMGQPIEKRDRADVRARLIEHAMGNSLMRRAPLERFYIALEELLDAEIGQGVE